MAEPVKTPMILNSFQIAMLETYSDGDYAYMADDGFVLDPLDVGDTLLSFLLIELSSSEVCVTLDDAQSRLKRAGKDIKVALKAIKLIRRAMEDKLAEHRIQERS